MKVAFYKGTHPGLAGVFNRLVRWVTRSQFSHVELVFSGGLCASATGKEGLRLKKIELNPKDWEVLDLPESVFPEAEVRSKFDAALFEAKLKGGRYDIYGVFATILPFLCREHPIDWFCSEIVMHCLGFEQAWRFNPADAYSMLHVDNPHF